MVKISLLAVALFAVFEGHQLLAEGITAIVLITALDEIMLSMDSKFGIVLFSCASTIAMWNTLPILVTLLTTRIT